MINCALTTQPRQDVASNSVRPMNGYTIRHAYAPFLNTPPPQTSSVLETALWAESQGLWPIPITAIDGKKSKSPGKAPIGLEWGKERRDADFLRSTFKRYPKANIGLKLGAEGGIIDIDVDQPEHAGPVLKRLFPDGVPATLGWENAKGRIHWLFRWDDRLAAYGKTVIKGIVAPDGKVSLNKNYVGVEIRLGSATTEGKQLQSVIPPSLMANAAARRWNGNTDILPLPESFFADLDKHAIEPVAPSPRPDTRVKGSSRTADNDMVMRRAIAWLSKCDPAVSGSGGHNATIWAASFGPKFDLPPNVAFDILRDHYNPRCEPAWSDYELQHKIDDAYKSNPDRGSLLRAEREPETRPRSNGVTNRHRRTPAETVDEVEIYVPLRLMRTEGVNEAPDDPHRLGRTYVESRYFHPAHPKLSRYLEDFYEWRGGCYYPIPEGIASDNLTAGIKDQFDELNLQEMKGYSDAKAEYDKKSDEEKKLSKSPKMPVARKVTGKIFNDSMRALKSMTSIPHDGVIPFWLGDPDGEPDPKHILPTSDGLVNLASVNIIGDTVDLSQIKVYDPTPLFFSTYVLGYSFNPLAPKPKRWIQFVKEAFPNDPQSQRELQKIFGLLISPDTSWQKIFYLIGKTRSGKGTILRVLTRLIGESNCTHPALVELSQTFGLEDCLGKSLIMISDARIAGDGAELALLQERILKISGEDAVQVNRKHRKQFSMKLPGRFVIASNSVPAFRDPSGAFRSRMCALHFRQSFEGREDNRLFDDGLVPEMAGILNWAIIGRAMLEKDGGFTTPETAEILTETMSESDPIQMFVSECCDTSKSSAEATKEDMFIVYQWWCKKTLNRAFPIQVFGRNLRAAAPSIDPDGTRPWVTDAAGNKSRVNCYKGIAILPDVRNAAKAWHLSQSGSTY